MKNVLHSREIRFLEILTVKSVLSVPSYKITLTFLCFTSCSLVEISEINLMQFNMVIFRLGIHIVLSNQ